MRINFRKNGTCEIITQGIGSVTSRCRYRLNDSIVEISKNYFDSLIISKHLLIRPMVKGYESNDSVMLYQIDGKMNIISGSIAFQVRPRKHGESGNR